MDSPEHIADALGRIKIAEALGVGVTAVSNAVVRGKFPASWFIVISGLCADAGIACPAEAFNMKRRDRSDAA